MVPRSSSTPRSALLQFRRTENPWVLGQHEKLLSRARSSGLRLGIASIDPAGYTAAIDDLSETGDELVETVDDFGATDIEDSATCQKPDPKPSR